MQKDEVLTERTNEDPIMVETTSTTLIQATAHNISMLNEKVLEVESENQMLKDEIMSLRQEMNKMRKVDDHLVPLKENILEQQEQLHDFQVECFTEIQKIEDKIKVLEEHLEIAYQINQKMESLKIKVEELDRWRNMEKNVPSGLPAIKSYDIVLHTLATNELATEGF